MSSVLNIFITEIFISDTEEWQGLCSPSYNDMVPYFPPEDDWTQVFMEFNDDTLVVTVNESILHQIPITGSPNLRLQ